MSEANERFLQHRINEALQWMRDNEGSDVSEQDALDHLMQECGQTQDGDCLLGGSEYCDFECPFRDGLFADDDEPPGTGAGEA